MNEKSKRSWRKGGIWIGAALVGIILVLVGLNMTRAPLQLARAFVEVVEEETGWDVELRGARFAGMTTLRLTDVAVRSDKEALQGELPIVDIAFNPINLFSRQGAETTIGSVRLIRPRFTIGGLEADVTDSAPRMLSQSPGTGESRKSSESPDFSLEIRVADGLVEEINSQGETARLWRVDGQIDVRGGEGTTVLRQARLKQVGGGIEARLAHDLQGDADVYTWQAKGPAEFFLTLLGIDQWKLTGAMEAEGTFSFAGGAPRLAAVGSGKVVAVVSEGEFAWGEAGPRERAAFDSLKLELQGEGETWQVESLVLEKGDALVQAAGEVKQAGSRSDPPEMMLSVSAKGLAFPDDLPVLEGFGLGGKGEFDGLLSGSLFDPALSGKLTIRDGKVWHRPVSKGEGVILLTNEQFRFEETRLEKGSSTYALEGEVRWANTPGSLELVLDANRGDLSEILKAFSIDADASGQIDGTISIHGPFGGVQIAGEAVVSEALVGGVSYFDQARGSFAWNDGLLTLRSVEAQSGHGVAVLAGTLGEEALALDVALTGWPLAAGQGALASLPEGVEGWASYRGRLSGSVESPQLNGELLGGELELGRLLVSDPRGMMSLTLDSVEVTDLSLVSAGQGRYRLSGSIDGWRETNPTVDLDVNVEGASLSGLLREGGVALPTWLFDGRVDGSIRVSGEALQPDATFDLALADDLGVTAPIQLQFGLQDGRFKLSRNTLLSAIMNASSR